MKKLIVWGAGGHGKVVLDVVLAAERWREVVFVDDGPVAEARLFMGHCVRPSSDLETLREAGFSEFIIAVGNNASRTKCYEVAIAHGLNPATAIHPTAAVSRSASVGHGSVVMPLAAINAATLIGVDCIINTGAIVEHDCIIGDHSHVAPGATIGGGVTIGAWSFVGINASILPFAQVGDRAVIGAGAVVLEAVRPGETVAGIPATPIGKKEGSGRRFGCSGLTTLEAAHPNRRDFRGGDNACDARVWGSRDEEQRSRCRRRGEATA